MTREEVDLALVDEPPGTFVLRFSERHPGQIGIAYVGSQVNEIKHYLVQPTGIKWILFFFFVIHTSNNFIRYCCCKSYSPRFPSRQATICVYVRIYSTS